MKDVLYEHIVARKSGPLDLIKKILLIFSLVIILFVAYALFHSIGILFALLLGFLIYNFVFTRLNVEYEYTLLNHDMDVDAIYSRQKRKRILSFDYQKAEIIAPKGSPRLNAINIEKTYDFSSGDETEKTFAIVVNIDRKRTCVIVEPDQGMINHMRPWMGSRFYLD